MKNNRSQSSHNKILRSIRSLSILIGFTMLALLIWHVSSAPTSIPKTTSTLNTNYYYINGSLGADSNLGSQAQPFKTIQKCLNLVQPGGTCQILGGTYNEALTLKVTGTASAPITLKCEMPLGCTVNSGSSTNTLITSGTINNYVIDGFRFITTFAPSANEDSSIKLSASSGMTFINNYVEGSIFVRGSNNRIANNELNGKGTWLTGYWERDSVSHDNIIQNNLIHNYKVRAIWSMDSIQNALIEGNTIHDAQYLVDCDGAGHPVYGCKVLNNHLYNVAPAGDWGAGVFLENCFSCVISGNLVENNFTGGVGLYSLNYGQGQSLWNSQWIMSEGQEYRDDDTHTVINNNVFNYKNTAMYFISVSGMTVSNNTLYTPDSTFDAVVFHAEKDSAGKIYQPLNEIVTNNIFYPKGWNWRETVPVNLVYSGNYTSNPQFVNVVGGDFHLQSNSQACTSGEDGTFVGAFPCH
jgi:hypothetical protein